MHCPHAFPAYTRATKHIYPAPRIFVRLDISRKAVLKLIIITRATGKKRSIVMAKKKASVSVFNWVVLGVLVIALVLGIVGLVIDQWTTTEEFMGKTGDVSFSTYVEQANDYMELKGELGDLGDSDELSSADKMVGMVAFAIITIVLVAIATVAYALKLFLKIGILRWVAILAGILAIVSALITIILTATFSQIDVGDESVNAIKVGAGAALLAVGGFLGGAAGASAIVKK